MSAGTHLKRVESARAHIAEMRDEESQKPQTANGGCSTSSATNLVVGAKKDEAVFGRGKYKLWALIAIVCLAFCSMFTGSITLKWSAVDLKHSSKDLYTSITGDLDILDLEERGKMVRQMWSIYEHNNLAGLSSFWREAFAAAYQQLTSDVSTVRDAAFLEIAQMSFRSREIHNSPPSDSTSRASVAELKVQMPLRKTRKGL